MGLLALLFLAKKIRNIFVRCVVTVVDAVVVVMVVVAAVNDTCRLFIATSTKNASI